MSHGKVILRIISFDSRAKIISSEGSELFVKVFKDVTARLDLTVKVSRGTATDARPRWTPAISGLSACQEQLDQCRSSTSDFSSKLPVRQILE
uniref:Uncharacterized protein n=1 Tax=Trichogramma kaykai TaxID=54128 RepID=A0ABD2WVS6_9HYME